VTEIICSGGNDVSDGDRVRIDHGGQPVIQRGALADVCVLIVDDNEDVRDMLQTYLEYTGAVAVPAASAEEAIFLFQRVRPHVVLTDIAMPVRDGHWLERELRTLERTRPTRTPVVAMTALSGRGSASAAVRTAFDGWLTKPLDLVEVGTVVARLARTRLAA